MNKGGALAELKETNNAKIYLHQAVTILEAMKQVEVVERVTDWCKLYYQIEF